VIAALWAKCGERNCIVTDKDRMEWSTVSTVIAALWAKCGERNCTETDKGRMEWSTVSTVVAALWAKRGERNCIETDKIEWKRAQGSGNGLDTDTNQREGGYGVLTYRWRIGRHNGR
jgi:hypothetical protein